MIKFERTSDYDLVKRIVTHPRVYPHVTDDFSLEASQWEPARHEGIYYLLVKEDGELLGLFTVIPLNGICWEIHTTLLPQAWGPRAGEAARAVQRWLWEQTRCERLVTNVPEYNRLALRFARQAGLQQFGVNPASYRKDGKLYDQIMLGVSRPAEIPVCH